MSKILSSLNWRQAHLGSEYYPIELEDGRVVRVRQLENGEVSGIGTGATVWAAAHVLSKYLEKEYGRVGLAGKRVCDIGAGTGVVGFVAAALGGTVTLTDQASVFFLLETNKSLVLRDNPDMDPACLSLCLYDWGETPTHLSPPFDLVLISDCVLPKLYPIEPLIQVSVSGETRY